MSLGITDRTWPFPWTPLAIRGQLAASILSVLSKGAIDPG